MPEETKEEGKLVGKITHYYGHVGVGVLELTDTLRVGDTIRVVGGQTDFTQTVESMEVEHEKVEVAKPGDSVGLKLDQKAKEGYRVYKL